MSVVANQIADVIATRIASGTSIERPLARGYSPSNGSNYLDYGGNVRAPEYDLPGNPFREARKQTYVIHICERDESTSDQVMTSALERYGVIVTAIKNANDWYTFGGLAVDAEIGDFEPIELNGGMGGIVLPLEVIYRTPENAV